MLSEITKESIDQSFDILLTLSELKQNPMPSIVTIMEVADKVFTFLNTENEDNDLFLSLAKNYLYEKVNREELEPTELTVDSLLNCAIQFRTEISNRNIIWNK